MSKRGQVTLFVVIAILVVVLGLIIYLLVRSPATPSSQTDAQKAKTALSDCVKDVSSNAIMTVSNKGGYLFFEENSSKIAIYLENSTMSIPDMQKIESNIKDYISEDIYFCFSGIEEEFNMINEGNTTVFVKVEDDGVLISVTYPGILTTKTGEKISFEGLSYKSDARLKQAYDVSKDIVLRLKQNSEELCLSCVYNLGDRNNFDIEIINVYPDIMVFSIIDQNLKINEIPYEFVFGAVI